MRSKKWFISFVVFSLALCSLSRSAFGEESYQITKTELEQIKISLTTAQEELTQSQTELKTLKTELQTLSEQLAKSKKEEQKNKIIAIAVSASAGLAVGFVCGTMPR